MKKLLLSLAACIVAFAANAVDYYLIGGFNNWALAQASCKFTAQGDGTYVLDYKGTLTSGFKINGGDWNDANNYGSSGATDILTVGTTFNLTLGSSSQNIATKENITNPHLVFNPNAKTLLITGQAQQAEIIYGIHSGWFDSNWSTTNMTESNGKWVLANTTVPAGQFGIKAMDKASGSQTSWISSAGDGIVVLNEAMPCKVEGTNFSNAAGTYTFTFDPTAMTLTVTGTQTGDDPVGDPYANWWINIGGEFNNNDFYNGGVQPVEGIATVSNLMIGDKGFKVKIWNGEKDEYYIYADGQVPVGEWVSYVVDTYDINNTISGAASGDIYTVEVDVKNMLVRLTKVSGSGGDDEPKKPENVYVIGTIPNNAWNTTNPVEMSNDGEGVFTLSEVEFENGSDGATSGYFALITIKSSDWNVVNANRFGPAVKDTDIQEGENVVDGKGDLSWAIPAGKYSLTFNYNEMTLKVTKLGSVVDPDPDPEKPEPIIVNALYVVGDGDGMTWTLPGTEYKADNNVVTFTLNDVANFKASIYKTTEWDGEGGFNAGSYNAGADASFSEDQVYPDGQTLPIMIYGQNQTLPYSGNYIITYDFNNMTMTVVATSAPSTEAPEIYLRGAMNDWGATDMWKFEYENGEYVFTCTSETAIEAGTEFKIADAGFKTINLTYAGGEISLSDTEATTVEFESGNANTALSANFTGTITVKLINNNKASVTFTPNTSTGVEGIEAAEGEAVYFNLQGARVMNPDKGIFIKVANGKAAKVVK